jgi:hypothetical protein
MSKININLNGLQIEVEGEESFVDKVYADYKDILKSFIRASQSVALTKGGIFVNNDDSDDNTSTTKQKTKRGLVKSKRPAKAPQLDVLDDVLQGQSLTKLKTFFDDKHPNTAQEKNTLFVYFLKQSLDVKSVAINHVYTCYKRLGIRYPTALRQSLADTAFRKRYLDTSSFEDIKLTAAGENFIEHELPRKSDATEKE